MVLPGPRAKFLTGGLPPCDLTPTYEWASPASCWLAPAGILGSRARNVTRSWSVSTNIPRTPELAGCVNDAQQVAAVLREGYGFEQQNIHLVLDKEATRAGILAAIKKYLIDGSKPGDLVLFLYSGHGTSIPDVNGDEPDKMDEAICPVDSVEKRDMSLLITDDEMGQIVDQIKGRQFIFIHDSCFSGTGLRDLAEAKAARVRWLPTDYFSAPRSREAGARQGGGLERLFDKKGSKSGFSFTRPRAKDDVPEGGLYSSGCRSDETSQEYAVTIGGREDHMGAMTFHLLAALGGQADANSDKVVTAQELKDSFNKNSPCLK